MSNFYRCRKCGETSFHPEDDMVRTAIRHWKHFKCLTLGQIDALKEGDKRRFNMWYSDYKSEQREKRELESNPRK